MLRYMHTPKAVFLREYYDDRIAKLSVLRDRTEFLRQLASVFYAAANGFVDKKAIHPSAENYFGIWVSGVVTRDNVLRAYEFQLNPKSNSIEAQSSWGFVFPICSEFLRSDIDVTNLVPVREREYSALVKKLAKLSAEEWVDSYGFTPKDVESFIKKVGNRGLYLSDDTYHELTQRERTLHMYILMQVHEGMQSMSEEE